jgi:secreted trypsin-like serine protease
VTYQEKAICNQRKMCTDNCGGTILDGNHVLTAAHCVGGKNLSDIVITAGVHNRLSNETDTRQVRGVDRLYMHPDWEPSTMANDLALLRLDKPVELNKYVQPACLPVAEPQTNANVVLTGWGAEALGGGLFDELKQAQVKVIGDCGRYWNLFNEKIQLCVGQQVSGDSACQGDSGGPLVQEYNGQWVLQGVTSYIGDCKTNENYAPNVYSKVVNYVTWIKSIIG